MLCLRCGKVYTEDFFNHKTQYSHDRKSTWRKCIIRYSHPSWPGLSCLKPIYLPLFCLAPIILAFFCLACFCNSAHLSCVHLTEHSFRCAFVLRASDASSSWFYTLEYTRKPKIFWFFRVFRKWPVA